MLTTTEAQKFNRIFAKDDSRLPIIFKALGDTNRCKIFRFLADHAREKMCVSDISKLLNVSIPAASQHLKILEITGLLKKHRQGRKTYFEIEQSDSLVKSILKAIS